MSRTEKVIKCLLLKTCDVLVTEVIEIDAEIGDPNCKLLSPCKIDPEGNLTPWPNVTDQRELMIHSDSILTMVDPLEEIIQKYLELTE